MYAAGEDRAHDLRIMRPTRCQLRYCRPCWSASDQAIDTTGQGLKIMAKPNCHILLSRESYPKLGHISNGVGRGPQAESSVPLPAVPSHASARRWLSGQAMSPAAQKMCRCSVQLRACWPPADSSPNLCSCVRNPGQGQVSSCVPLHHQL